MGGRASQRSGIPGGRERAVGAPRRREPDGLTEGCRARLLPLRSEEDPDKLPYVGRVGDLIWLRACYGEIEFSDGRVIYRHRDYIGRVADDDSADANRWESD